MKSKTAKRLQRPRVNRPRTAKEVFKILDDFMSADNSIGRGDELQHVWDVLTALRGPDYSVGGGMEKTATTALIRSKVFGSPTSMVRFFAKVRRIDTSDLTIVRRSLDSTRHSHFYRHAERAFAALDLKWDEVNP
jgi:hypothetical protein